jgi:hypothetical protein
MTLITNVRRFQAHTDQDIHVPLKMIGKVLKDAYGKEPEQPLPPKLSEMVRRLEDVSRRR